MSLLIGLLLAAGTTIQSPAQDSLPGVMRLRLLQPRASMLRTHILPQSGPLVPTLECPMPVVIPTVPELGRMPVVRPGMARQPAFLHWSPPCSNPLFDAARLPERRRPRE